MNTDRSSGEVHGRPSARPPRARNVAVWLAIAAIGLLSLGTGPAMAEDAGAGHGAPPPSKEQKKLNSALENIKGVATPLVGSLSGLGVLLGGGMIGLGMQSGTKVLAGSAAAGGGVLLGNGVISLL